MTDITLEGIIKYYQDELHKALLDVIEDSMNKTFKVWDVAIKEVLENSPYKWVGND